MNFHKDPRLAKKMAREQAHLRKVAKRNPDALKGKEKALCEWDIEFDNFEDYSDNDKEQYADSYK